MYLFFKLDAFYLINASASHPIRWQSRVWIRSRSCFITVMSFNRVTATWAGGVYMDGRVTLGAMLAPGAGGRLCGVGALVLLAPLALGEGEAERTGIGRRAGT